MHVLRIGSMSFGYQQSRFFVHYRFFSPLRMFMNIVGGYMYNIINRLSSTHILFIISIEVEAVQIETAS